MVAWPSVDFRPSGVCNLLMAKHAFDYQGGQRQRAKC